MEVLSHFEVVWEPFDPKLNTDASNLDLMSIFEFFFKYKPIIYEKGHLAFQLLSSRWLFVLFIVAAAAGAYYAYKNVTRDKYAIGLVVLRAVTFTLLAFIFLRPVLNISTVLPQ